MMAKPENGQARFTAEDIMAEAGVSRRTLNSWQEKGIIPAPVREANESGHGSRSVWTDDVRFRCVRLARMTKGGRTLSAAVERALSEERWWMHLLRELIADPAFASDPSFDRAVAYATARAEAFGDLSAPAEDFVRILLPRVMMGELHEGSAAVAHVHAAMDRYAAVMLKEAARLAVNGVNPVLIVGYAGVRAWVVPDFVLPCLLSEGADSTAPGEFTCFTVVPMEPFVRAMQLEPKHPRTVPAFELADEGSAERGEAPKLKRLAGYGFELRWPAGGNRGERILRGGTDLANLADASEQRRPGSERQAPARKPRKRKAGAVRRRLR